jgi:hypothetical protein
MSSFIRRTIFRVLSLSFNLGQKHPPKIKNPKSIAAPQWFDLEKRVELRLNQVDHKLCYETNNKPVRQFLNPPTFN